MTATRGPGRPPIAPGRKRRTLTVTLPQPLIAAVDEAATSADLCRSHFVEQVLAAAVAKKDLTHAVSTGAAAKVRGVLAEALANKSARFTFEGTDLGYYKVPDFWIRQLQRCVVWLQEG